MLVAMSQSSRVRRYRSILLWCCLLIPKGALAAGGADSASYLSEIEAWRGQRLQRLTAEDGWLTLIGLYWLDEGANTIGSKAGSAVLLPAAKAPDRVGTLTLVENRIRFEVSSGVPVLRQGGPVSALTLETDASGNPTILGLGDLSFHVIERSGRYAVRVRDRAHPARLRFDGIESFPVVPEWRLRARLAPHDPAKEISVPTVMGTVSTQLSPGVVIFEVGGDVYRLEALTGPDRRLFLIFADQTSGRETYGGGRFLYSEPVDSGGSVVLDFNKAYNPPCAFTDFATCPLPPRQNKLALRIDAGEKRYAHH